jgi:hypothetical protein
MPPSDHVLDTNVLLVASTSDPSSPFKGSMHVPPAEQRKVLEWLKAFRKDGSRKLVLDVQRQLMGEYQKQLSKDDLGRRVLMEKFQTARLHSIEMEDGSARLPEPLRTHVKDLSDRKFVAVALADAGNSTLVNACDTDWHECEEALQQAGIIVEQLIPEWCRGKYQEKLSR